MTDARDLRDAYKAAWAEGKVEQAGELAAEIWATATDRTGWDAWQLARAQRKLGNYSQAMAAARDGLAFIKDDPQAVAAVGQRLAGEFGWATYQAELKSPQSPQPARVAKATMAVARAWDQFADGTPWTTQYCPVPLALNRGMKLLKEAEAWHLLAEVASATDGDQMPDTPIRESGGDDEGAAWTRAESWYTAAAKALIEDHRHADAVVLINRAMAREQPLGAHCLRWLYVDGTKAAIGLRDGEQARRFAELARSAGVRDWWMDVLAAEAADLNGDHDVAVAALAHAFLTADRRHVAPEFLCSALDVAARLLQLEEPELARDCARVHRGIRETRGWRVPEAVDALANGLSEPEDTLARFVPAWRRLSRRDEQRAAGAVTRLLSEGSGFLRDDDGIDRYFSFPRGAPMPSWCVVSARVSFMPITRLDRKDGVEKPAATELESIE